MTARSPIHVAASKSVYEYVGKSAELPEGQLPTLRDVYKQGLLLRERAISDYRNYDYKDLANDLSSLVVKSWLKVNAQLDKALLQDRTVSLYIEESFRKLEGILNKRVKKAKEKKIALDNQIDKLFNICYCKCPFLECSDLGCAGDCEFKIHLKCTCPKHLKIPRREIPFIHDQRSKVGSLGKLQSSGMDQKEVDRQNKAISRKRKSEEAAENREIKTNLAKKRNRENMESFINEEDIMEETGDGDCEAVEIAGGGDGDTSESFSNRRIDDELKSKQSHENTLSFTNAARESIRFNTSLRGTAAIVSGTLIDVGYVTSDDVTNLVDKNKIHRERSRIMEELREAGPGALMERSVGCIFFDGKNDWTKIMMEDENGKLYPGSGWEEHYSVTIEPGGEYFTHFVPDDPRPNETPAMCLARGIMEAVDFGRLRELLYAIGADSTNTNTGWKGGCIHFVEVGLGKKLLRLVCQLHTNELPLRHLIVALDGPTGGTNTFQGPLGRAIGQSVEDLETNPNFEAITSGPGPRDIPQEVVDDLSNDQKYGYQMVQVIRSGVVNEELAKLKVGPISHARWLTTANRFMRLYISKHGFRGKNLKNLKLIVGFIVSVYYVMWFDIKCEPLLFKGPGHVLKQVQLVRDYIPPIVKEIVEPYIRSGAWHAHSENILLACLSSNNEEYRRFGIQKILSIRGNSELGDTSVRPFKVPQLNWEADNITNLINWENAYEPNVTCSLSKDELHQLLENPLSVEPLPCHTQSIERVIREVSTASENVYGFEKRDGFIRAKIESRKLVPKHVSKKSLIGMTACAKK